MEYFPRELVTEWRRLDIPVSGASYVIAVSGGADSVSLLRAIAALQELGKLENKYIVAHFNHGLRGVESDGDQKFVEKLAADCGFSFEVESTNREALEKIDSNLEQACRRARYLFLYRVASENECIGILTGHTRNDQAEQFLLNLIRGSGTKGLSGMLEIRKMSEFESEIELIRPLLRWANRDETVKYASANDGFRIDASNSDRNFLRVRVREELLPIMKEANPRIIDRIADTANQIGQIDKYVETRACIQIEGLKPNELPIRKIIEADVAIRGALVREWLKRSRKNLTRITKAHIDSVVCLAMTEKSGRIVEMPGGNIVEKHNGLLRFRS